VLETLSIEREQVESSDLAYDLVEHFLEGQAVRPVRAVRVVVAQALIGRAAWRGYVQAVSVDEHVRLMRTLYDAVTTEDLARWRTWVPLRCMVKCH
jgi:hypothetical protein